MYKDQIREHQNAMDGYPVRISAIHLCFPDTPMSRIIRAAIVLSGKGEHYMRFQMHLGGMHLPEIQYQLMTYGIPTQEIPATSSGVIKTKNHSQWINSRKALEEMRESVASRDVVIHPGNDDVLFSQGGSKTRHYGNVKFRSVLQKYMEEYQSVGKDKAILKAVRNKVIKHVEAAGGSFLMLDKKMNWWVPISDPVDLDDKIASSFYYQSKKPNISPKSQESTSECILFLQGNKRRKLEGQQLCCSDW
jgi:hypothetical protein